MASCLEKNFGTFFNFGYFFSGLQATVSDFGQKTSYCQIRLKKLHSPTKHLEKNLKFYKKFFSEPFFRKLVIFSKLQLPSLWNRAWAISNFLPNLVVFDFAWRFSAKCEWIFPKNKFWPDLLSDKAKSSKIFKFEIIFSRLGKIFPSKLVIVWCLNDQLSAMASCLEKNFGTFFNFGYFFCGLQATVSDFGQKTSYCQIRLKKLHSQPNTLKKI